MKVKDLIKILQKFDENLMVFVDQEESGISDIYEIVKKEIAEDRKHELRDIETIELFIPIQKNLLKNKKTYTCERKRVTEDLKDNKKMIKNKFEGVVIS